MKYCNRRSERGQGMVEFVLILFIVMILCSGMLYSSRLLTFDFWAQQEARYLAFEQTWVPAWYRADPKGDPVSELDDSNYFRRPSVVDRLDADKEVVDDGNISDLLPILGSLFGGDDKEADTSISERKSSPSMFARGPNSIWNQKSTDWIDGQRKKGVSLVRTAFARHDFNSRDDRIGLTRNEDEEQDWQNDPLFYVHDDYEQRHVNFVTKTGFGEKLCRRLAGIARNYGHGPGVEEFTRGDCAEKYNTGMGVHMARNLNYADLFREFGEEMEWGHGPGEGWQVTWEKVIATQFYSLFDLAVAAARFAAPGVIVFERFDFGAGVIQDSDAFVRMLTEWRYAGSSVALGAIAAAVVPISLQNPLNRNPQTELDFETTANEILHADVGNVSDLVPLVDTAFLLNPVTTLPVPPIFGPLAGGLQNGLMENVLSSEILDDGTIDDRLIDDANKVAQVDYVAEQGLFPAARRRWNTDDKTLTSRFYLVTQPWHITRRESPTGAFREKGTQTDTASDPTEEGILRKRVLGLWLIPSNPIALLSPVTDLLPGPLGSLTGVLEDVGNFVGLVKDFVTDNPLLDIFDWMSELPLIGSVVPTLPKWPAVRPDAYPNSEELSNNSGGLDQMSGDDREFQDYIQEQLDLDPEPKPDFNEAG